MDKQAQKDLLKRYREGQASAEELSALRGIFDNPSPGVLDELLQQAWQEGSHTTPMVFQAKDQVLATITSQVLNPQIRRKNWTDSIRRYAAAIAFMAMSGYTLYLYHQNEISTHIAQQETVFSSPASHRAQLTLPDGTLVDLNSNTTLRYKQAFGRDDRQIFFDGEAYFDVAKNPEKPFIINTKDLRVEVFGTSFNFYAYSKQEKVELALVEGSLRVSTLQSPLKCVELAPNEKVTWDRESGRLVKEKKKSFEEEIVWNKKRVSFEAEPLAHVFKVLSRRFGVTFDTTQIQSLLDDQYSASFTDESLDEILVVLQAHYPVELYKEDDTIRCCLSQ